MNKRVPANNPYQVMKLASPNEECLEAVVNKRLADLERKLAIAVEGLQDLRDNFASTDEVKDVINSYLTKLEESG